MKVAGMPKEQLLLIFKALLALQNDLTINDPRSFLRQVCGAQERAAACLLIFLSPTHALFYVAPLVSANCACPAGVRDN